MRFEVDLPEEGFRPSLVEKIEVQGQEVEVLSCPCTAAQRDDSIGYFFRLLLEKVFDGKCWCEEETVQS